MLIAASVIAQLGVAMSHRVVFTAMLVRGANWIIQLELGETAPDR
jgi:hypothetical protein